MQRRRLVPDRRTKPRGRDANLPQGVDPFIHFALHYLPRTAPEAFARMARAVIREGVAVPLEQRRDAWIGAQPTGDHEKGGGHAALAQCSRKLARRVSDWSVIDREPDGFFRGRKVMGHGSQPLRARRHDRPEKQTMREEG